MRNILPNEPVEIELELKQVSELSEKELNQVSGGLSFFQPVPPYGGLNFRTRAGLFSW